MRYALALAAASLMAVGCGTKIEVAEGDCPDLLKQAFRDASFETDEEEEALQSLLLGIDGSCFDTLDQDYKDRVINPGPLTAEYLDGLPQPEGTVLEEQTPVALSGLSTHELATHIENMRDTNQTCIGSGSTKYSERNWTEGEACFFDGTCSKATATGRTYTKNLIAQVWIDNFSDFYRTTVPFEDGEREVIVSRGWISETFNSGFDGDKNQQWRQRYVLDLWYADASDPSKTRRYTAFWSEADLAVGDNTYVGAVIDGLEEAVINTDLYFDGEDCETRDWGEDELREKWG